MLALTKEDNSLVGILDVGNVAGSESSAIGEMTSSESGNMYNIAIRVVKITSQI